MTSLENRKPIAFAPLVVRQPPHSLGGFGISGAILLSFTRHMQTSVDLAQRYRFTAAGRQAGKMGSSFHDEHHPNPVST